MITVQVALTVTILDDDGDKIASVDTHAKDIVLADPPDAALIHFRQVVNQVVVEGSEACAWRALTMLEPIGEWPVGREGSE